jgi:hypothetical protein
MTTKATSSGNRRRCSRYTYFRSSRLEIVGAYVEGRPIPRLSSSFTSEASVYRGGGWV